MDIIAVGNIYLVYEYVSVSCRGNKQEGEWGRRKFAQNIVEIERVLARASITPPHSINRVDLATCA